MSKKGRVLVAMSGGIDSSLAAVIMHEQGYEINSTTLINSRVLIKKMGEGVEISGLTFKSQLKKFFEDCNKILERLNDKIYKFKDMVKIAEDYENCGSEQDEITISNNVKPASRSLFENLRSFRLSVTNAVNFDNKSDLIELVDDIIQNLQNQEIVPSYLWLALVLITDGNEEINSKAKKIREKANQGIN